MSSSLLLLIVVGMVFTDALDTVPECEVRMDERMIAGGGLYEVIDMNSFQPDDPPNLALKAAIDTINYGSYSKYTQAIFNIDDANRKGKTYMFFITLADTQCERTAKYLECTVQPPYDDTNPTLNFCRAEVVDQDPKFPRFVVTSLNCDKPNKFNDHHDK